MAIESELLDFKQEVWQLWLPLVLPWIPITIWLRPKFRILVYKNESDRKQFGFQALTAFIMWASMIISQMYLTRESGKLQQVTNVEDLDKKEPTTYYQIGSFHPLASYGTSYTDFRASGQHNEHLNIHIYFTCPIVNDSLEDQRDSFKYWYGVSFKKQIGNRLSTEQKKREYQAFFAECVNKMNRFES